MELDEMKLAWAKLDQRQADIEAMIHKEHSGRHLDKFRAAMRLEMLLRGVEIVVWIAFVVFVATFWVAHRHTTHLLLIGLGLHVYGIAAIWSNATQLLFLSRIYLFDAPVLVQQRRLAQLRRFRVYSTLSLGLPWWFLWLIIPLVVLTAVSGEDAFAGGAGWIGANMAVGAAGLGASVWLAHRLSQRPIKSPLLRRLVEDMSGCGLRRAERQMQEIARFERE